MTMMANPLYRQVRSFCRELDMLLPGGLVLCAVSGGRDSMALLHLLSALAGELGFRVAAAHFNHQLRSEADRDEQAVRDWCRENAIYLETGRGDVRALSREVGTSLEDAARTLRYRFLEAAADRLGAVRIATAHHREDNAETVLLHLLRGTGLRGLGGIPPVRGRIVRPLLASSRADIDAYVKTCRIPYVEDESNRNPIYTRNRLRQEVLPLLEEIAPGCGARLAGTAALLREEEAHLQREAEALLPRLEGGAIAISTQILAQQDPVLRRRLVRTMADRMGVSLSRGQTEAVLALKSGGFLDLPGGICAFRSPGQLTLKRQPPPLRPLTLREGGQDWGPWHVTLERTVPMEDALYRVVLRDAGEVLTIAPWDGTGRLRVENGSRTIKRLFAGAGVPVEERSEHPAILMDGKTVAVAGIAEDWAYRPREGEPQVTVSLCRPNGGEQSK